MATSIRLKEAYIQYKHYKHTFIYKRKKKHKNNEIHFMHLLKQNTPYTGGCTRRILTGKILTQGNTVHNEHLQVGPDHFVRRSLNSRRHFWLKKSAFFTHIIWTLTHFKYGCQIAGGKIIYDLEYFNDHLFQ